MAFVGLGLPLGKPGPRPSTPCPDFQCQPVKGTCGKETQPDLEAASWFQMMTLRWLVFFLSLHSFHFSFVFKIEHLTQTFLFRVRRKLTVVHQCLYHLPGSGIFP